MCFTNCHSILNMGIAPPASHTIYESVVICTLGGVSHVLLSSLAHVGSIRHFVPSTLSIFTLTLVKVHFGHFWQKWTLNHKVGDFWNISRLRELNPEVGYELELFGLISSIDLDWSQPLILRFPFSCLKRGKGVLGGRIVHRGFCSWEEEVSSYGCEVRCMRIVGGGR